jgi:hypothetical protein
LRVTTPRKPAYATGRKSGSDRSYEADSDTSSDLQQIRLQLLGKPDVTITLPGDFDAADWRFLKPILEAYIARLTGT